MIRKENYTQEEYNHAKHVVRVFEEKKKKLSKITGSSVCPFCSGTKVVPFLKLYKNQDCKECDKNGMISNKILYELDLLDFVKA